MSIDTQPPRLSATLPAPELSAASPAPEQSGWDEPSGATARGTLIVLAGRGEAAGVYERFGRRIAADAYRVRVIADATLDVAHSRALVADLLADATLPEPKVLVGSDAGAALALAVLGDPTVRVAAAVLAGLPFGDTVETLAVNATATEEAEVRSACPVHRRTLADPSLVTIGALARPLPGSLTGPLIRGGGGPHPIRVPVLAIHGDADAIAPVERALALYRSLPGARILTISAGRHDALNDVSHRSVAAAIVLFLERVRLATASPDAGAELTSALPRVLNVDGF